MARFKVLEGAHSEHGKLYKKGDVFESDTDLLKLNRSTPPKFARLDDRTGEEVVRTARQGKHPEQDTDQVKKVHTPESLKASQEASDDGYEKLSEEDLKEIAESEEIPLRGGESKAELIRLLRENS